MAFVNMRESRQQGAVAQMQADRTVLVQFDSLIELLEVAQIDEAERHAHKSAVGIKHRPGEQGIPRAVGNLERRADQQA